MVAVKQTIPVHERSSGWMTIITDVTVGVDSALDENFVVLVLADHEYTVRADDLRTAIDNAVNTGS